MPLVVPPNGRQSMYLEILCLSNYCTTGNAFTVYMYWDFFKIVVRTVVYVSIRIGFNVKDIKRILLSCRLYNLYQNKLKCLLFLCAQIGCTVPRAAVKDVSGVQPCVPSNGPGNSYDNYLYSCRLIAKGTGHYFSVFL